MSDRCAILARGPTLATDVHDPTYSMPVSGSNAPPSQFAPPSVPGRISVPRVPSGASTTDGGVNGLSPSRNGAIALSASARSSGVKSIRSSTRTPCRSNAAGFDGIGCVAAACSPGTSDAGTGRLDDRPHRLARHAIEHVRVRLLRELHDGFDAPAVDGDVREDRRRGVVAIPDVVMDDLEVPDALAGARVEAHERRREQVVTEAMAAVVVAGGGFDRQIQVAALRVERQRRPRAGVARVLRRSVLPGVVAELALLRESC